MILKVKKLSNKALIPSYMNDGDSGMDLFSIEKKIIYPNRTQLIRTGIAIELPKNTEAQIRSRSGLALSNSIVVLNSPGTIDQGYRGEIGVILINFGDKPFEIVERMRIAQLVIKPTLTVEIEITNKLSKTKRNKDGFGSTGLIK